jgi:hypothetical protein
MKHKKKHHKKHEHKEHYESADPMHGESHEEGGKNWIKGAIKHKGALRKELHVKKGHKIPKKKLAEAAKHGGKEGKRARLAETLGKMKHKGK